MGLRQLIKKTEEARQRLDCIPDELQQLRRWVVWKNKTQGGQARKLPYSPLTGRLASTTTPATWSSFDEARKAGGYDGIGFVFIEADPYVGIDLDHVIDDGQLAPWVEDIVNRLAPAAYIEVSPSGKGLHAIVKGRKPGPRCKRSFGDSAIEIYDQRRYFTMTGERWGDEQPAAIGDGQAALDEIYARLFDDEAEASLVAGAGDEDPAEPEDEQPLNTAAEEPALQQAFASKNADRIRALWQGDTTGYGSRSEADLALCSHLAYWTDNDASEVDRLFKHSGLMREKWERDDYRQRTLEKACGGDLSQVSLSQPAKGEAQDQDLSQLSLSQPIGSEPGSPDLSQLSLSQDREEYSELTDHPEEAPQDVPFPIHALPPVVRLFVEAVAAALGVDLSMVAGVCLAALAGCIGNRRRIMLKASWCEPAILWIVLVMRSGGKKTPCLSEVLGHLQHREASLISEYQERKRAAKEGEKPPPPERLIVSNITTEGLLAIHADSPLGLMLYRDELDGWLKSFNAYKKKDGGDTQNWLEMHQGKPALVDRKSSATLSVPRASVSVIGGIQPSTLRRSLAGEHLENGLAARLLFVVPEEQPSEWRDATISQDLSGEWEGLLGSLLALAPKPFGPGSAPEPIDLPLKDDAKALWIAAYNDLGERLDAANGPMRAALSKLEAATARLALILQLASDPNATEVGADAMRSGIEVAQWFEGEAQKIYEDFEAEAEADELEMAAEWIRMKRKGQATAREFDNRGPSSLRGRGKQILYKLVEMGKAERQEQPGNKGDLFVLV